MGYLVAIIGLAIAVIGLVGLVEPRKLLGLVDRFWTGERSLYIAAGLRIGIGSVLILASPYTSLPALVTGLGVISFVAGIALMIMGYDRVDRLIRWFGRRPPSVVRVSALFAMLLGVILLLAGV